MYVQEVKPVRILKNIYYESKYVCLQIFEWIRKKKLSVFTVAQIYHYFAEHLLAPFPCLEISSSLAEFVRIVLYGFGVGVLKAIGQDSQEANRSMPKCLKSGSFSDAFGFRKLAHINFKLFSTMKSLY